MNSLAQQKKEYTIQLYISQMTNVIAPIIYDGFKSIYDESFKFKHNAGIETFGHFLKDIPNWSSNILETEVKRIIAESKLGDYMSQLFNIIMMSTIMVMTATPNKLKNKILVPESITFVKFIHNVYINAAEQLFVNPYVFNSDSKNEEEIIINKKLVYQYIAKSIDNTFTKLIPLTYILDNYMGLDTDILTEKQKTEKRQDIEISELNKNSTIQLSHYIDNIGRDKNTIDNEIQRISESADKINKHVKNTTAHINKSTIKPINELSILPNKVHIPTTVVGGPHTKFKISDIPESEAYYANVDNAPLDVFNNTPKGDTKMVKGDTNMAKGDTNMAKGDTNMAKGNTNMAKGNTKIVKGDTNMAKGDTNMAKDDTNTSNAKSEQIATSDIKKYVMNIGTDDKNSILQYKPSNNVKNPKI